MADPWTWSSVRGNVAIAPRQNSGGGVHETPPRLGAETQARRSNLIEVPFWIEDLPIKGREQGYPLGRAAARVSREVIAAEHGAASRPHGYANHSNSPWCRRGWWNASRTRWAALPGSPVVSGGLLVGGLLESNISAATRVLPGGSPP